MTLLLQCSHHELNLCSAHSRLAKRQRQHIKCPCTDNTVSLIHFCRIVKNRRAYQNTTKHFICQKQTDNPKWLILSTYITDMCTNITDKKNEKIEHTLLTKFLNNGYFLITFRTHVLTSAPHSTSTCVVKKYWSGNLITMSGRFRNIK